MADYYACLQGAKSSCPHLHEAVTSLFRSTVEGFLGVGCSGTARPPWRECKGAPSDHFFNSTFYFCLEVGFFIAQFSEALGRLIFFPPPQQSQWCASEDARTVAFLRVLLYLLIFLKFWHWGWTPHVNISSATFFKWGGDAMVEGFSQIQKLGSAIRNVLLAHPLRQKVRMFFFKRPKQLYFHF